MEFDIDSLIAELGVVPPPNTISDASLINQHPEPLLIPSRPGNNPLLQLPPRQIPHSSSIFIGAVVPPVPPKLVDRIKGGEFIDMAELLPDRIGSFNPSSTDESAKQKVWWCPVTSIIEWVQCFNVYMSVICRTCPERIPDLLTYQMLIIEASMVYEGNAWLGYDRRFRQAAAVNPRPGCSFLNCKYKHICSLCVKNPASGDKSHKAVLCPYHSRPPGTNTTSSSFQIQ